MHVREKRHRLLLPHFIFSYSSSLNLLAMSLYIYLPQYNYPTPYIPNLPLFWQMVQRHVIHSWEMRTPPNHLVGGGRQVHLPYSQGLLAQPLLHLGITGSLGITTCGCHWQPTFLQWLLRATEAFLLELPWPTRLFCKGCYGQARLRSGSLGSALCGYSLSTCLQCDLPHFIPTWGTLKLNT